MIEETLAAVDAGPEGSLDDVLAADAAARDFALRRVAGGGGT